MEHLPNCGRRFHFPAAVLAVLVCLAIGLSLWLALPSPASAHTHVERSTPPTEAAFRDVRTSLLMITRWIGFLAAFLLVGSVVFQATVLGPGLGSMHPQEGWRLGEGAAARLRALQADAAIGLLAILAAEVGLQATLLLEAPLSYQATGARLWQFLVETTPGWSVLIKGSLALALMLPPSLPGAFPTPRTAPFPVPC